jgi:hypothetical protein
MDETADGFLVLARRRFFNQAGRRPKTDSLVFDLAMFTPSMVVIRAENGPGRAYRETARYGPSVYGNNTILTVG